MNRLTTATTAKAFSGESARRYLFMIDGDSILVWDQVAGQFTSCHSLCESEQERIRALAENPFLVRKHEKDGETFVSVYHHESNSDAEFYAAGREIDYGLLTDCHPSIIRAAREAAAKALA